MKFHSRALSFFILVLFVLAPNWALANGQPGFLLVAPDRRFLGNQEVRQLLEKFQKDYLVALAFAGNDYESTKADYAEYFTQSIQELQQGGATTIITIPLFLSASDPQLHAVKPTLLAAAKGLPVQWAPLPCLRAI